MASVVRQAPLSHTPYELELELQFDPDATQRLLTQQPSPAQADPSQHGSPGAPHFLHVLEEHTRPAPVQKLLELPPEPVQQDCPSPPHVPHPPRAVEEHVPVSVEPPQPEPAWTHLSPTQQPPAAHVLLPQQG